MKQGIRTSYLKKIFLSNFYHCKGIFDFLESMMSKVTPIFSNKNLKNIVQNVSFSVKTPSQSDKMAKYLQSKMPNKAFSHYLNIALCPMGYFVANYVIVTSR